MSMYIASPMSRKAISDLVYIFRDAFGLTDVRFFPVVEFLEHVLPEIDKKFCLEISDRAVMGDTYGLTYPEDHKIMLREDVYENAIEGVPRDRFTIAHEIGHYILHKPNRIALSRSRGEQKSPAYLDPEWQANAFAGELLVPRQVIQDLSVDDITRKCGVSRMVAEIQKRY
jgi:Zn-dependent peptidase ImmA (M78 family)